MTVTSNIHLNIVGWANTTYAVGARVSNTGNAYQCTTGGASTSPPTGTGSGINNGGVAVWKYLTAIDYTTMQAWANDTGRFPLTLTAPIVASLWHSGGPVVATYGTPILTLSGHTTSGSNTITIQPAAGESFQAVFQALPITPYVYNSANGVSFQMPGAITIITPGGSFTDLSGNVWSISGGAAQENGSPAAFSSGVVALALVGATVWQKNNVGSWYSWSGTTWNAGNDPTLVPTATVIAGSGGSFIDGSGNSWTISSGGEALENLSAPAFSANVIEIALINGVVWQFNNVGQAYSWSGSAWVNTSVIPIIIGSYFQINDNNVILRGLQFSSPVALLAGAIIGGTGANLSIQQCIIDGYAQLVGAPPVAISGANFSLTNSLIVGRNITAGGAMISTLGGIGAVIANNTFVHTTLVSGQNVLDAGANVTSSSNTSTNNIFYNYTVVYI